MNIAGREIGPSHPPFVVAELGINAAGSYERQMKMIWDAHVAGAECVKGQTRIPLEDLGREAHFIKPSNADETVWDLFVRCSFSEQQERDFKQYAESLNMIYLSTPYSSAGVDRLERLGVAAYKIGSGEARDLDFLQYVASKGKPIILSTGMSNETEIDASLEPVYGVDHAVLECTSEYPCAHSRVRLGAMARLRGMDVFGLSDHSPGIWTCLGAVALGASILEKHFTSDKSWTGPDIPVSIDPAELRDLIVGSRAIWEARGGEKTVMPGERATREWYEAARRR